MPPGLLRLAALFAACAAPPAAGEHLRTQSRAVALAAATGPSGLKVGTAPGTENVVSSFEITGTWSSNGDLASDVGMEVPSTNLYLSTDEPLVLSRAKVEPALGPNAKVFIRGPLASRLKAVGTYTMKVGETTALEIVYECLAAGSFGVTLTLEFDGLSPVTIPWKKTCGGTENAAIHITGGPDNEEVVIAGKAKWDESKVVGTSQSHTDFVITVEPLAEQQAISTPIANAVGTCSVKVESPVVANTAVDDTTALSAKVRYDCITHGQCVVSMAVPFFPDMAPYKPNRWTWTKMCGGTAIGVDVEGESNGEKVYVARDGASNDTSNLFVEKDQPSNKIFLVNDVTRSNEPELRVHGFRLACLDSIHCSAALKGAVPQFIKEGQATALDIDYDCRSSGSSLVQLFIETEGHDPIQVMWTKECEVWRDSLGGIMLISFICCTCAACACVGAMNICCKDPVYVEGYGYEGEEMGTQTDRKVKRTPEGDTSEEE